MARPLTLNMEATSIGDVAKRSPAWKVELWDVRAGLNTISQIITGESLDPTTGPFDASEFVRLTQLEERAGDYITSGVPSSIMTATVEDPDGQFNPDLVIGLSLDFTDPVIKQTYTENRGRFFRRSNLVRVTVGDTRVPESEWVEVFTGLVAGQAGYASGRVPLESILSFKAYGREATFLKFERTTDEFTNVAPPTTYLQMAQSVAENEMGLATGEINFAGFGGNELRHRSLTLAKENPLSMLAKIMFIDGFLPKFDGSGILTQTSGLVSGSSDRFYPNNSAILSIKRPLTEVQPPDAVCVIGLNFLLSKITQPYQVVGEMNITTGYFTSNEELEIFWSSDRTQRVTNVDSRVLKSVNAGISPIGGEDFEPIPAPTEDGVAPDLNATIGFTVTIDTGIAPWLVVFFMTNYIGLSALPDNVLVVGFGASDGFTINIGAILAALALASALYVMTKLGRGQYRFLGEPFEFVYEEIRECAAVTGVTEFDRIEIEVLNHLVDNAPQAQVAAREQLFRQQARSRPRDIIMFHDLGLEPDDTFELLADGRRFLVDSISYKLERGSNQNGIVDVKAFEITDNIQLAT